jgi:ATP-dependent DNA ligase
MSQKFPILYHKGKSGALYSWTVYSEGDTITSIAGQVNGLKTLTSKRVEQKNIGKKNETSLEEQADKEAQAMWTFKLERKYSETKEDAQIELELPMLAKEFEKCKKKVIFPVDVQPKYDGVRCLGKWEDGKVVLTSRSGKPWNAAPHVNEALAKFLPKESVIDGELYIHGATFQAITRLVKKQRPESLNVKYHVYDLPDNNGDSDLEWKDRKVALDKLVPKDQNVVVLVPSVRCSNEKEVKAEHDRLVQENYEGAIIRVLTSRYRYGYRSDGLLKLKAFEDAEFEITGHETGVGRYENCPVLICKAESGEEFRVNPKLTIEEKEEMLKNIDEYIGKMYKVRFNGRSEAPHSLPRFGRGLGIRDEKDT